MALFHLPVEIIELIFDQIVMSRTLIRVLRARLVNGQFKHYIDRSVFRRHSLVRSSCFSPWRIWYLNTESISYLHSYIMCQVSKQQPTAISCLGQIRLAARSLDGSDDDLECLSSLVRRAMMADLSSLLRKSTPNLDDSHSFDSADTEADAFTAAAYLGRKDYVSDLIAKGVPSFEEPYRDAFRSTVFGSAMDAAISQRNLEIIKLLLLRTPQYCSGGTLPTTIISFMLQSNNAHSHRGNTCDYEAVFNFIVDIIFAAPSHEDWHYLLEAALTAALSLSDFERVAARFSNNSKTSRKDRWTDFLMPHVMNGNIEIVRYILDEGVSPNLESGDSTPLMAAIMNGNDAMVKMLLGFGANPAHQTSRRGNALMTAVWRGWVSMASSLLNQGVDPNEGYPPPVVLAVFKEHPEMFRLLRDHDARLDTPETGGFSMAMIDLHKLSSMQDILVDEGVSRDVARHYGLAKGKDFWMYQSLWDIRGQIAIA